MEAMIVVHSEMFRAAVSNFGHSRWAHFPEYIKGYGASPQKVTSWRRQTSIFRLSPTRYCLFTSF